MTSTSVSKLTPRGVAGSQGAIPTRELKWHDNRLWRHTAGRVNALFSVAISGIALAFSIAKPLIRLLLSPLYLCVFKERSLANDLKRDLLCLAKCAETVVRSSWRVLTGERSTDSAFFKVGLNLGCMVFTPETISWAAIQKTRFIQGGYKSSFSTYLEMARQLKKEDVSQGLNNLRKELKEAYRPHELINNPKETIIRIAGITLVMVSIAAAIALVLATQGVALAPLLIASHHIFGAYAVTAVGLSAEGVFLGGISAIGLAEHLSRKQAKKDLEAAGSGNGRDGGGKGVGRRLRYAGGSVVKSGQSTQAILEQDYEALPQ